MDETQKEELIRQFRDYLENDFTEEASEEDIDQLSLFNELAGLKNEVKIESRQLKAALDSFHQAFTSLDNGQQELVVLLQNQKHKEPETDQAEMMAFILGLIDIYDRIDAGLKQEPPAPSFMERLLPAAQNSRKWVQGHIEGQRMLLGRVNELLSLGGVAAIVSHGQQFDQQVMKAIDFAIDQSKEEGVVLQEVRKGFKQDRRVVRLAEVIVNKKG